MVFVRTVRENASVEQTAIRVGRVQELTVKPPLQERAVVVTVPVKKPDVDAVVRRRFDLAHRRRTRLVLVAPQRHARLAMSGETRLGALGQLPLAPPGTVYRFVARIDVIVGKIVPGNRIIG